METKLIGRSDCQKLALVGLGGVGKTQVALRLAYTVKDQWPDCSIFWVPAVSEESFEQAYRKVANDCSIKLDSAQEGPKETVQRYLSSKAAGRWLFIVDNADDEEILFGKAEDCQGIADYLPNSDDGMTLITTRYRKVAVSMAGKDVVDLEAMSDEEAESFLRNSLIREDLPQDEADMTELLTEMTNLPLAITQAAAYLNAMQVSLREYLSLLKNTEQDTISLLSREFRDETRYKPSEHSKNAIATTWLVSFNHIQRSDPVAADLLSFISCIEDKAIPRQMLPQIEPAEQMVHALATLRAYAFVTPSEDGQHYDMHRLVHIATKIWSKKQGTTETLYKKTIAYVCKIFPLGEFDKRFTWREYFPHVFRLLDNSRGLDEEMRNVLLFWVGRCLQVDGRYGEAVDYLSECCHWRQMRFPEDHRNLLASQHNLAVAYLANDQIENAIAMLEHVVRKREVLKEDDFDRLGSQHALASAYLNNREVKKAIVLLEKVVGIQAAIFKEDDRRRLVAEYELARAYLEDERVKDAIGYMKRVLGIHTAVFQAPDRLVLQYTLARALLADEMAEEAIALFQEIIRKHRVISAEDHPHLLDSQHELARAYQQTGQVDEAIALLEHIVLIESKSLAEDRPRRLISRRTLARVYSESGQVPKAIEIFEKIVSIESKSLAEDNRTRLVSQHELALAYLRSGQAEKAIELLERIVLIRSRSVPEDDPERLGSQYVLALAYHRSGQAEKAIELLEQVGLIRSRSIPDDDLRRLLFDSELSRLCGE